MGNITNAQYRHDKIEAILAYDAESLSHDELEEAASLLREEADRLMARIQRTTRWTIFRTFWRCATAEASHNG